MNKKVIKYEKNHAYAILYDNLEHGVSLEKEFEQYVNLWESGDSFTLVVDDSIVCCGGVVSLGWNRGEAWMLLSQLFYKYPKTCFKECKRVVDRMMPGFKRIQATIFLDGPKTNYDFLKRLGFVEEGILKAYGPKNEDVIMFARVSQCNL